MGNRRPAQQRTQVFLEHRAGQRGQYLLRKDDVGAQTGTAGGAQAVAVQLPAAHHHGFPRPQQPLLIPDLEPHILSRGGENLVPEMPVQGHLAVRPLVQVVHIILDGEKGIREGNGFLQLMIQKQAEHSRSTPPDCFG